VADAGARAHYLHIARFGAALVAQAVLVGDGAFTDIGDDFHVGVGMGRETRAGGDGVVVPHPQRAPAHAGRIVVAGEGKVVLGIEPAVVGTAKGLEGTAFDHGVLLLRCVLRWMNFMFCRSRRE